MGNVTATAAVLVSLVLAFGASAKAALDAQNGRWSRPDCGASVETSPLGRAVPGFGGLFRAGPDNALHVYLLDPTRAEEAREALRDFVWLGPDGKDDVVFLQGQYTRDQLVSWFHCMQYGPTVPSPRGAVLWGMRVRENRIVLGVENERAVRAFGRWLDALGIPRGAVIIGEAQGSWD
jgi:hypothetical protein